MKEVIMEMERYADTNNVPIIDVESIKFIMKYIKLNNVKSFRNRYGHWILSYFNG